MNFFNTKLLLIRRGNKSPIPEKNLTVNTLVTEALSQSNSITQFMGVTLEYCVWYENAKLLLFKKSATSPIPKRNHLAVNTLVTEALSQSNSITQIMGVTFECCVKYENLLLFDEISLCDRKNTCIFIYENIQRAKIYNTTSENVR